MANEMTPAEGPVKRSVRPQLPAMEIPIFESPTMPDGQPDNLALWRAYEALRADPCEAKAEALRHLRASRTSWFDREETAIRRMIDKALDLWPN